MNLQDKRASLCLLVLVFFRWCDVVAAVLSHRVARQERREIKDLKVAEDRRGKRASWVSRDLEACRETWVSRACRGRRDQR